jgi:hypothetical protein
MRRAMTKNMKNPTEAPTIIPIDSTEICDEEVELAVAAADVELEAEEEVEDDEVEDVDKVVVEDGFVPIAGGMIAVALAQFAWQID